MFEFDWQVVLLHFAQIGIAYLLALPIAWDRERQARTAGLRTFPLVSVSACGYMLTGIQVLDTTEAQARVFYGIIAGMGFIGGGAILKDSGSVEGTATAASLWMMGAIGIAVAYHRYEIAVILAAMNVVTMRYVKVLKEPIDNQD